MHKYSRFDSATIEKLKSFQIKLSKKVILEDKFENIRKVAGVDIAYKGENAYAALVIIDKGGKMRVYTLETKVYFPYIPGLLAFRELKPIILLARNHLKEFDVLFVNGHGIAHPRGLGIASHVGVLLKKPTIGVAKRLLFGRIGENVFDNVYKIVHGNRTLGFFINKNGKKYYISPGNFISLDSCLKVFLEFFDKNPIEIAHNCANAFKKGYKILY